MRRSRVLQRARRRRLDQVANRREGVEEEVRIDLRAQRPQLGFGRPAARISSSRRRWSKRSMVSRTASMRRGGDERGRLEEGAGRPRAGAVRRRGRRRATGSAALGGGHLDLGGESRESAPSRRPRPSIHQTRRALRAVATAARRAIEHAVDGARRPAGTAPSSARSVRVVVRDRGAPCIDEARDGAAATWDRAPPSAPSMPAATPRPAAPRAAR